MYKKQIPIIIIDNEEKNLKDKFCDNPVTKKTSDLLCNKFGIARGGIVEIMEKDIKGNIISETKANLIVYEGRENLIQMAFDKNRDSGDALSRKDLFIYWLSVGTGGTDGVDVLSPVSPSAEDKILSPNGGGGEVIIDAANAAYADGGRKIPIELGPNGSHPGNTLTFEQDTEQITSPYPYLIAKVSTTIDYGEANGNDINEAALWLTNSRDASDPSTQFKMWARISCPTKRKINTYPTQLNFTWYIYF